MILETLPLLFLLPALLSFCNVRGRNTSTYFAVQRSASQGFEPEDLDRLKYAPLVVLVVLAVLAVLALENPTAAL